MALGWRDDIPHSEGMLLVMSVKSNILMMVLIDRNGKKAFAISVTAYQIQDDLLIY